MTRRGKKYRNSLEQIDKSFLYSPKEAFLLLKKIACSNFDETIETHFNLGIDPRHADQQLRGTLVLPNGTGKSLKIAVIAQGDNEKKALSAGADEVGNDDLIGKIENGWLEFDILIATPDMMSKLGKLGRVLGSRGLMPNPKSGTVTTDIENTVKEFKSGKVEYRNDKTGIIHIGIGKKSFSEESLVDNFMLVYDTLLKAKPSKSKGVYLRSISVSSSQSPGFFIEPTKLKWKE
jgi:large subunit ribosomal protein L1